MARSRRRPAGAPSTPTLVDLMISEIGAHGDGVARHEGSDVFVPFTMPGDRVRACLLGPHHALPVSWHVRASSHRIPACPHFGVCGGCALQHLEDGAYLDWKRSRLEVALGRRGLMPVDLGPIVRTPPAVRRRAELGMARRGKHVTVGFHAYRSAELVALDTCAVLHPDIVALLPALRRLALESVPDGAIADVTVTRVDNGLDLLISQLPAPGLRLREVLADFAATHDLTRVSWRHDDGPAETIIQRRVPVVSFAGIAVAVPPGAFLQASRSGEEAIVAAVRAGVGDARRVADLYAGCGTLTLSLARQARVHAVEGEQDLCRALTDAARRSGLAGRVTSEVRDLSRRPLLAEDLAGFDCVVFNPPREGAAAQAAEISRSRVPTIVAVSCNPATFARDARILVDGGYRLCRIMPVDQFLWSSHLELVGIFRR